MGFKNMDWIPNPFPVEKMDGARDWAKYALTFVMMLVAGQCYYHPDVVRFVATHCTCDIHYRMRILTDVLTFIQIHMMKPLQYALVVVMFGIIVKRDFFALAVAYLYFGNFMIHAALYLFEFIGCMLGDWSVVSILLRVAPLLGTAVNFVLLSVLVSYVQFRVTEHQHEMAGIAYELEHMGL